MFANESAITESSWRAFERCIMRLYRAEGFSGVRLVAQTGDRGADVIAHKSGRRFLLQAKHWKSTVGLQVVDETLRAMRYYSAHSATIVAWGGFEPKVRAHQQELLRNGISLQLIDRQELLRRISALPTDCPHRQEARGYQEPIIQSIVHSYETRQQRAMIVMATGLGKTFTAAEAIRRIRNVAPGLRVLVLAHSNELVYQLEQAFWATIGNRAQTLVWNGHEPCSTKQLSTSSFVFACSNTASSRLDTLGDATPFDVVVVDECHHAMADGYLALLSTLQAGNDGGPFLLGMTATPFRRDQRNLSDLFGHPTATLDLIEGMRRGFLANVDYRLHTDNIDWTRLRALNGSSFSPANINKTLFIQEWDDAVVHELQQVWGQVDKPRAIVFCGTIEHAIMTRDRINSLSFCRAEALYSQSDGRLLPASERSRLLCDFQDGRCQVICAVDILNEGIDVPDVNIIVFQRVTHSRRIFVQQLGRGLRIAPGKESVIVLDFVSDIRRFAAGLEMQRSLNVAEPGAVCARIGHKVRFARRSAEDIQAQRFITEWLSDAGELQDCPDEVATLRFPPTELLEIH